MNKSQIIKVQSTVIAILALLPAVMYADTVEIYPIDDAFGYLYDDDAIVDWDEARNFDGVLTREPIADSGGNNVGNISVRSDDGAGTYRIYRVSKVFDLTDIPTDAILVSATLNLYKTDANSSGDTEVVVTSHNRDRVEQMQKEDWYITEYGTESFSRKIMDDGYNEFSFNEKGLSYLSESSGSLVVIGLLTGFDFDGNEPTGFISSAGWNSIEKEGAEFDPYLEIEYRIEEPEDALPLYTQIESSFPSLEETASWADDTYAQGGDYWCGSTIAGCGCVITSLVMAAQTQEITQGVDGSEVNPGNLNAWLQANDGYTKEGSIKWVTAADYFGTEVDGEIMTPWTFVDHQEKNASTIANAVEEEDMFVLGFNERFGHYFVLDEILDSGYAVRDPLWFNTKTTDDDRDVAGSVQSYDNAIARATVYRLASAQVQRSSMEIIANSPVDLLLSHEDGDMTGQTEFGLVDDIANSAYSDDEFIGNPFIENQGAPEHLTKRLIVMSADGNYELSVTGTDTGPYTLSFDLRTATGDRQSYEFIASTTLGQVDTYEINLQTGEVIEQDDEEEDDKITRAEFISLVETAVAEERKRTQRFLLRFANRVFDAYEADREHVALVRLRVFGKLLRYLDITDAELQTAVQELNAQIKEDK